MSEPTVGMSPKQIVSYARATGRVNIFEGSIRAGKTFSWLLLLLVKIKRAKKHGAIVIVGKNRDSIYRNVFEPIETIAAFARFSKHVHYRQGAPTARIFGKPVHVIGANDAKAENKIRGMTIQLAFLDEVTVLHVDFFKQLLGRMSVPGAQLFGTTNPDSPAHWLKREYLDRMGKPDDKGKIQLPDWRLFHFTIDDNPSLDETYKESIRTEYTGLWFRRFILGEWVAAEGAIYDLFDEEIHVVKHADMPNMRRVLCIAIDYGTTHPTAGILLGLGIDNKLYAMDEFAPERGTDAQYRKALAEWLKTRPDPEYTFVDPAAASFKLELHEAGWPRLFNATNDVLDGIRLVASLLSTGQLFISDRCVELRNELPGYRWDETAGARGDEKPIKEVDDFCDALRYSVASSQNLWQPNLTLTHAA
ncbi:PBSX family phage terminase large subunit [Rhodococcus qingshengii]|uniref:PBSX family phage terminase large subunit n=1 Tax=Rhodococcus qingshengii TaxID=334542 RepID=UPI001C8B8164|nr:PBSX family phage terminase large subunit [Rhodococcus qingshengii]MBX9150088.1 PBSX family phage terminase large subunit [Rhodococcus qingshengii]